MEIDVLKKAGLTESQAKGYLALVENGDLTPNELAKITEETRTNAYAIVDKLINLGLASKTKNSKTIISAENPTKIRAMINSQQLLLKETNEQLGGILPSLLSKFRLKSDQPGVMNLEGAESLNLVYDEIISTKQDVLIFPSQYDNNDPKISKIIEEQIARQHKAGIKSFALIREQVYEKIKENQDDFLQIKKIGPNICFDAQIMIFGNIIVMTVFNHGILNTIITSPDIASTMREIFYALWNNA